MPMIIMATIFRNVGRKKGMELLLTGRRIDAREAERLGLINYAVPAAELDAKVDALAAEIASLSPAVIRLGREAFYTMADLEFERALDYLQAMLTMNLGTYVTAAMEDNRDRGPWYPLPDGDGWHSNDGRKLIILWERERNWQAKYPPPDAKAQERAA